MLEFLNETHGREQDVGDSLEEIINEFSVLIGRSVLIDKVVKQLPCRIRNILHFGLIHQMISHFLFVLHLQFLIHILRVLRDQVYHFL